MTQRPWLSSFLSATFRSSANITPTAHKANRAKHQRLYVRLRPTRLMHWRWMNVLYSYPYNFGLNQIFICTCV